MQGLKFVVAALIAAVLVGGVFYVVDQNVNPPAQEQST